MTQPTDSDSLIRPAGAGLLYDRGACGEQSSLALLDPDSYADAARPVSARGGRGAAWFVSGACGEAVLRHYRRGGLMGRVNADRYFWLGAERTRCVREYRLLRQLHRQGLPVPAPLAAGWWRSGLFYRQALLTARIAATQSLAQLVEADAAQAPWQAVGQTIARFHLAGVWHADLNAHNILRDDAGRIWLIDFDRCVRGPQPSQERSVQNLQRLRRSLRKVAHEQGEEGWRHLHAAWLAAWRQPC